MGDSIAISPYVTHGYRAWLEHPAYSRPTSCLPPAAGSVGLPRSSEVGVDLEPPGRQVVRHFEQRLELVERLVRLAYQKVDAGKLVLNVRADVGIIGSNFSA